MKKRGMLGIIGGAALLTAAPFSLQWSQDEVSLSLNSANARIGRPYRGSAYVAALAGVAGYSYGSYYGYSSPYYSSYYAPQPYSTYYRPVRPYVRTINYRYPPAAESYY